VGASNLAGAKPDEISTYQGMQEAGSLLLLLAIIFLAILNFTTLRNLHATSIHSCGRSTEQAGTLAVGTLVALHLAAVRVIYSVVYTFTHSKILSPITGTFAVKLCLITLVQLGASLALVAAGVSTSRIQKRSAMRRNVESTELREGLMK
jgi:ATP/ADP translocase